MPTFVHSPLLWGLLLVGVPVLIHLINMLRHRRVEWAAMEFLLQSQRKNRTWILLKQLLLLATRMAVIALIVAMVAKPRLPDRFGRIFGGIKTHHIVLLDDSYSMSQRWADRSALGEAKAVVQRIGVEVSRPSQPQAFTLLRFSQAGQLQHGTYPDVLKEPVDQAFPERLEALLEDMEVSQTAAEPIDALQAIDQLLGDAGDERRIVYLVTDFRQRQWDDPTELREQLLRLSDATAELHLVNCAGPSKENLAVASIQAVEGIHAAGVPLLMDVAVRNAGSEPARDVSVLLEEDGRARPAVKIDDIPPGETVEQRFLVRFATAGEHQVVCRLESDAVALDNVRYQTLNLPSDVPVLLVDGSPEARDARFLSIALAPGGSVQTGISPRIETLRFLTRQPLAKFQSIVLMNIERLDRSAVEALEEYVDAGGGLAMFVGEASSAAVVNSLFYRDGEGFFPAPLAGPSELLIDRLNPAPDVQVGDHFMFRVFGGDRNSFLNTVTIQRYFAVADDWRPAADSSTRVIARLRNADPLAIERRFGRGRVISVLTTLAPVWNNWARNPSFVVAMQDMQAYLASGGDSGSEHRVGVPLELLLDAKAYLPQVRFVKPPEAATPAVVLDAVAGPDGSLRAEMAEADASGIYEARLSHSDGEAEVRRFAVNVDPLEGDLNHLDGQTLATRLEGIPYQYTQAAGFQFSLGESQQSNLWKTFLYILVFLLIGEQILALSASYHPPRRAGAGHFSAQ